jgi:type VII secretion protein EccB
MASRRDLIQGFQFAARRVVSAMVMRQTDPTEWPNRRLGGAGFGAIMLTLIALAAVGVFGFIVPGGKTSWKDGQSVIVVKETGAPFVYIDGKLHPVLNFTSAALLVGHSAVTLTSSASLMDVPRGVVLGIPDAPTTVPKDADIVTPPWSLCTQQVPDATGKLVSRTRLVVTKVPKQGSLPGDAALLVTDTADNNGFVIWHDHRYFLADPEADRQALQLDNDVNVPVGDAWLKTLPTGQPIGPSRQPDAGQPSTAVPGAKVGDLFAVTQGQGTLYYLAEADQLLPISALQAAVQQARHGQARSLSATAATAARKAPIPPTTLESAPATVPQFVRPVQSNTVICASYQNNTFTPQVLVDSAIPENGGVSTSGYSSAGVSLADRIWLPPGHAAVVESLGSPSVTDGPLYLVTDVGRRYAIPDLDVLRSLGLTTTHLSKMPASLLQSIPEGPVLDPVAARRALQDEYATN